MKRLSKRRLLRILVLATVGMALAACGDAGGAYAKRNVDLLKEAGANMKAPKSFHVEANTQQKSWKLE